MEPQAGQHTNSPAAAVAKSAAMLTEGSLSRAEPAAAAPATSAWEALPRFYGYLLEVRAEVQNLKEAMGRVRRAATLADSEARAAELAAAHAEGEAIDRRNRGRIAGLLGRLRGLMEAHPTLHQWCADQIIHIENCWERVEFHLDRLRALLEGGGGDGAALACAAEVDARLQQMVFLAAYLTIPQRVNEHLRQLRIGQALDFHRDFADELPELSERVKLLVTMRAHPNQIHGIVDVERGVIYKTATQRRRHVISLVAQVVLVLLGVGLFALLPVIGAWEALSDRALLLERYLFVGVGALLHLSMSTLKQRRRSGEGEVTALDDFILWIHVREVAIAWTVVTVWIGVIGLSFVPQGRGAETALIVGYSLDSFIDVFLMRFEQKAGSVTKALGAAPR
jgi:hypothetical protein